MTGFTEVTLDGCCSEGGGARGLVRAGHYVIGVDTDKTCRDGYLRSGAHEFIHADIMDVLQDTSYMRGFTFASLHPPCQAYSTMSHCQPGLAETYPRLIRPVYAMMETFHPGLPYVIENVMGARDELPGPVVVCMYMFGRPTYRHRVLWAGGGLSLTPPAPPGDSNSLAKHVKPNRECGWPHPVPTARAGHWEPGYFVSVAGHERKAPVLEAMEIGWMSHRDRVKEAIPPYLGWWIAQQLAAWRARELAA